MSPAAPITSKHYHAQPPSLPSSRPTTNGVFPPNQTQKRRIGFWKYWSTKLCFSSSTPSKNKFNTTPSTRERPHLEPYNALPSRGTRPLYQHHQQHQSELYQPRNIPPGYAHLPLQHNSEPRPFRPVDRDLTRELVRPSPGLMQLAGHTSPLPTPPSFAPPSFSPAPSYSTLPPTPPSPSHPRQHSNSPSRQRVSSHQIQQEEENRIRFERGLQRLEHLERRQHSYSEKRADDESTRAQRGGRRFAGSSASTRLGRGEKLERTKSVVSVANSDYSMLLW
ncbi:hypothetical protein T439DRAFT_351085 [Meredithblackwellia eburnea MCA 4105]